MRSARSRFRWAPLTPTWERPILGETGAIMVEELTPTRARQKLSKAKEARRMRRIVVGRR